MEFVTVIEKGVSSPCEVAHRFSDLRAIVKYDGLYVMASRFSPTEWELSEPARRGVELRTLNILVKRLEAQGTTVTETKE